MLLLFAGVVAGGASTARSADCGTPPGKILIDDVFKDGLNGWDEDTSAIFAKPHLTLKLAGTDTYWNYTSSSFDVKNADYCLELAVPTGISSDNITDAGLIFNYVDDDNKFQMLIYSDGSALLERENDGKYTELFATEKTVPPLVPGAKAVLHVTVKDDVITAFINDVQVKQVRAKMPEKAGRFGVYAERSEAVPTDTPITFDHLRVTEIP